MNASAAVWLTGHFPSAALVPQFMSTALATIENRGLAALRAKKRKHSDACIKRHVGILEQLASANGGLVPTMKWLNRRGYFQSYCIMLDYPASFAHLKREEEKKFDV